MYKDSVRGSSRYASIHLMVSDAAHAYLVRLAALGFVAVVAVACSIGLADAQCVSIVTYGGSGNGTTNNSPALASAFAALATSGGCIAFPAGRYKFSTAVTFNFPSSLTAPYSVSLVGAGIDNTTLYFAASNGITFNAVNDQQTTHLSDLTFSTGSAGGYSALTLNNANPLGGNGIQSSDIDRTTFRGDDGGAGAEYWNNGVNVVGQSDINFDSDQFLGDGTGFHGNGINLSGSTSGSAAIVYNISKCGFFWNGNGLAITTMIQGVTVTQSNFTNGETGINALAGGTGLTQLSVTGGNQFNTQGTQIWLQQPTNGLIVSGNLFFVLANETGIWLDSTGGWDTIANNVFAGYDQSSTTGILVSGSNPSTVVTGNTFNTFLTGINLTGTSGWNVQANVYNLGPAHGAAQVVNIGSNSVGVVTN